MCGICGFVNLDGAAPNGNIIQKMNNAMLHRGPDDEGTLIDGSVALAMRRLSIMDVDGGHQPISNEDASVWTVFNGEIYNAEEMRSGLIQLGHRFATQTDTEVIVHQYEEDGIQVLQSLRGMFGFALLDKRASSSVDDVSLLIARDRLGIKPLYYYSDDKLFAFSSELTSLLQHPGIMRKIEPKALNQYLATGIVASPLTMFQNVKQLMPGCYLSFTDGALVESEYWALPSLREDVPDLNVAADQVRDLLQKSIDEHLVSDVPVGAFLSGGIDSSAIVALMARSSDKKIPTFSMRFEENVYDESSYARLIAKQYNTEHHEFTVPNQGFDVDLLRAMVTHHGQPTADSSALPTYLLSALTRQHVKVALSGDGGDECFAGYSHYGWLPSIERLYACPRALRVTLLAVLRKAGSASVFAGVARLRQLINALEASLSSKHLLPLQVLRLNNDVELSCLLNPEWRIEDQQEWSDLDLFLRDCGEADSIHRAQMFSCRYFMSDAYLPKVDRMSMAASLEVRVPFLDHRLVEYALSLPSSLHWQKGVGKRVLREAVRDLLPKEIFTHRKQGFSIPLHSWVSDEYFDFVEELLNEQAVQRRGMFKSQYVRNLIQRCRGQGTRKTALESKYRLSHRLFQLVILEMWCQMYIDDLPEEPVHVEVNRLVRCV